MPQAIDQLFRMLDELAAVRSEDDQELYVYQHPLLLEPGSAEALEAAIADGGGDGQSAARAAALTYIREIRGLWKESEGYPVGVGPIETLWLKVSTGELSLAAATERLTAPDSLAALTPRYLRAICGWGASQAIDGGWRAAVPILRLALAAVDALPPESGSEELRAFAATTWADVVRAALVDTPDARLLRDADERGRKALDRLGTANEAARARLLYRLGVLFLDPYTANRIPGLLDHSLEVWLRKTPIDFADEDAPRMPEPLEAVKTAQRYLRQAAEIDGPDRGNVLKALLQSLEWQEAFGEAIDKDETKRLAAEAAALLEERPDSLIRFQLLVRRAADGEQIGLEELAPVLTRTPDELEHEYGFGIAVGLVVSTIEILRRSEPRRALDLIRTSRPLLGRAEESTRHAVLDRELKLLVDVFAPEIEETGSLERDAARLRETAAREARGAVATAAGLLRLVERAGNTDQEELGLGLLQEALEASPLIAGEHTSALILLQANLFVGAAVNALRREDWSACAQAYGNALQGLVGLGHLDNAMHVVARIDDIVGKADVSLLPEVTAGLAPIAARLETARGDAGTEAIQTLIRHTLALGGRYPINPVALHFLVQIAKGARLAPILASGTTYVPAQDEYAQRLLQEVAAAESQLSDDGEAASDRPAPLVDEEMVLNAYARVQEPGEGGSAAVRFGNLQRAYDEWINAQLLFSASAGGSSALAPLEALAPALGDRTVLLNLYFGATADGDDAVYVIYVVGDEVQLTSIPHGFPSSMIEIEGYRTNPFGMVAESIRRKIQEPFLGRGVVSRAAEADLERYLPGLLGKVSERLDDFRRAGRDHLCFVPHGPLHYFPFHLLGPPDEPLAADFAVSYLPHINLLTARWNRQPNPEPLAAFGVSFEGDPRPALVPLRQAVSEAREIAELFGTEAFVEERATEQAIISGLTQARYVHLATHGRHNVNAPAFQCLYSHPSPGTDGRLSAYELVGLDLRGVRLVTMSACETALGRFDAGDNLRGLPASFFIAGVTSLVGTLWAVDDDVSRFFFVTFYRELQAETPLLDAFVNAQRATRDAYPEYRDWGAFYLAGDWNEPEREEAVA